MAGPVLLVHDDIAEIAAVRRLLVRDGYEVMVVSSAADALITFGHYLPTLIILSPSVEGHRGHVILEELRQHPDAKLARVLLLGETVPGFGFQVAPMPLDGTVFLQQVAELIRGGGTEADQWKVVDLTPPAPASTPRHHTRDEWRATGPLEVGSPDALATDIFEGDWQVAAMTPEERDSHQRNVIAERQADAVANFAFEQAHQEIEAEAIASIERTIPAVTAVVDEGPEPMAPPSPSVEDLIHETLSTPVEEDPVVAEIQASLAERRKQREADRRQKEESEQQLREAAVATDEDDASERVRLAKARQEAERAAAVERDRTERLRARAARIAQEEAPLFDPTPRPGAKLEESDDVAQLEAELAARAPQSAERIEAEFARGSDEFTPLDADLDGQPPVADEQPAQREPEASNGAENADPASSVSDAEQTNAEGETHAEFNDAAVRELELATGLSAETAATEQPSDLADSAGTTEQVSEQRTAAASLLASELFTDLTEDPEASLNTEEAFAAKTGLEPNGLGEVSGSESASVGSHGDEEANSEAEAVAARKVEDAARAEAEAAARDEAEAVAAREAEEAARAEAEAVADREAEEAARVDAEAVAAREAEEASRAEAEAEAVAAREAAEAVRAEAEAVAAREAEEAARAEAEAVAAREAEEAARAEAEAEAVAAREAEEAARAEAEAAAVVAREAEEAARAEAEAIAAREAEAAAEREINEVARLELERLEAEAAEQAAREAAEADAATRAEIERLSREASEKARALAEAASREASERARREELELAAKEAEARADAEAQLRVDAETRAHTQLQKLASEREEARLRSVRLAEEAAEREVAANEAQARANEFEQQAILAREEISRAEVAARSERERREQLTAELERLRHLADAAQARALAAEDDARQERAAHSQALAAAEQQHLVAEQVARAEAAESAREDLEAQLAALQAELAQQRESFETEKRTAVERTRVELDAQRKEVEALLQVAAGEAERARAEAKQAASRTLIPLERPGKAPLPVLGAGSVNVTQLASLVTKLATSKSEARLELQADDSLRTLWFRRGAIVGAASTVPHDSLLDRARRDGLIDARQESELRLVRTAGSTEVLRVLKLRGFVRETEAVPLVHRHHEQIALEALCEQQSTYRLSLEPILDEVVAAELPRPPMHIVAEALRRALSSEDFLRAAGGMTATVALSDVELDGKALGFTDRERRMLSLVDGAVTIEEVLLGAGIKQEQGLKALAVAHALQLIEVMPPLEEPTAAPHDRDIERLEAKYEELADADYFSLLGLSRTAGTDEVARAFENLTREFDPIKFVGHPDAGLQHRARIVTDALAEAAQALQDDRLRSEYARNLLD